MSDERTDEPDGTDELRQAIGRIGEQLPVAAPTAEALAQVRARGGDAPAGGGPGGSSGGRRWLVAAAVTLLVGAGVATVVVTRDQDVSTVDPARRPPTSASPTTSGGATTSASTTSTAPVPTTTAPVAPAAGPRIRITESSIRASASVVDGASGNVVRELGSWPVRTDAVSGELLDPVLDGDLGPDGSAYLALRTSGSGGDLGGTELRAFAPDGAVRRVLPNVTNVRVSPDGRRAAVEILSPDGDGDGKGRHALRVVDLASGTTTDLLSDQIPLDAQGAPTVEIESYVIEAWTADGSSVVLRSFCCDSGSVAVLPANRLSTLDSLPQVRGAASTALLGFGPDGSLLVEREPDVTDDPSYVSGSRYEVVSLDPRSGKVSAPVTSGTNGDVGGPHYGLVGRTVPGTLTDRGRDALAAPGGTGSGGAPGTAPSRDRSYS